MSTLPSRNEFDEEGYLQLHPDVAAEVRAGSVGSGWQHFAQHGLAEGRQWIPKPDALAGVSREIAVDDKMFLGDGIHYFDVGESALHCVETAILAARKRKSSIRRILDLPCGHGRVLRFLKNAFPEAELTACDLNRDGVEYCAKTFGARPVFSRHEIAEIPLQDKFDLIWCGSLLTHFPQEKCQAFIRLFQQLLQPGGILLFTTHGRCCEIGLVTGNNQHGLGEPQVASLLRDYRQKGFGYVDYSTQSDYGFSLSHPSFVAMYLKECPDCRLIGFHEAGWDKRQDVISLQRHL